MLGRWTTIFRGHKVTVYAWIKDKREFFVVHHYGEDK